MAEISDALPGRRCSLSDDELSPAAWPALVRLLSWSDG